MRIFTKVREILMDNLSVRLEIKEIKEKLANQDKNIELVFSFFDELIEKHKNPEKRKLPAMQAWGKRAGSSRRQKRYERAGCYEAGCSINVLKNVS